MALDLDYLRGLDLFEMEFLYGHILLEVFVKEVHKYWLFVVEEYKEQVGEDKLEDFDMVEEAYKY
jgi:hypothetical protein